MSDLNDDSESELFDSDSSDDELEFQFGLPKTKNENYLENTVPHYCDIEFLEHFRVPRNVVNNIAEEYEASDFYKGKSSGQYGKLSALEQILIFLWFIGHRTSCFRDIADRFNIAISTVHRIIKKVSVFLSNLSSNTITWPANDEKIEIQRHFARNGFPGIIGAIDGCHIQIDKPSQDPESYMNRKGYYSVQMQVICDHKLLIRDIFMGYPGSVHDSRVFRNSPVYSELEERCGQYFILGDSGYPLQKNLLTPYKNRGQLLPHQINYNVKLAKNRYVIEHCFGVLKQKFQSLYYIKIRNITYVLHLMRAACVLHNMCVRYGISLNDEMGIVEVPPEPLDIEEVEDLEDANAVRIRESIATRL